MSRWTLRHPSVCVFLVLPVLTSGCRGATGEAKSSTATAAAIPVATSAAVERPLTRFIRVTGTLAAQEQADVAAEIQGRVVGTPVERGTRVNEGAELIRVAAAEAEAQATEAQANAAQLEERLGLSEGTTFSVDRVPEVANAKANVTLAQNDFDRAKMLFEKQLLSQADFDKTSAQAEVARRQYDIARNTSMQQYQALLAARARVSLARKAVADTVVRAPFAGVVGERVGSGGDYVTKGMKVVSVLRTSPLRLQLRSEEHTSELQ